MCADFFEDWTPQNGRCPFPFSFPFSLHKHKKRSLGKKKEKKSYPCSVNKECGCRLALDSSIRSETHVACSLPEAGDGAYATAPSAAARKEELGRVDDQLGPPVVPFYPVFGEGSPTKRDYRKKGALVLTSKLEDLVKGCFYGSVGLSCCEGTPFVGVLKGI